MIAYIRRRPAGRCEAPCRTHGANAMTNAFLTMPRRLSSAPREAPAQRWCKVCWRFKDVCGRRWCKAGK